MQNATEAALVKTGGFDDPQLPNTIFAENNVRVAFLDDAEIRKAEEMCSPEYQPQLWTQWRDRLNGWAAGGKADKPSLSRKGFRRPPQFRGGWANIILVRYGRALCRLCKPGFLGNPRGAAVRGDFRGLIRPPPQRAARWALSFRRRSFSPFTGA